MVAVAEGARSDADKHLRAQALVETVRASGEQLAAISSEALAASWSARRPYLEPSVVPRGFAAWGSLSAALGELRPLAPPGEMAVLSRDANALFSAGIGTLAIARTGQLRAATRHEQATFRPAVDRLNAESARLSRTERAVATSASHHATAAFIGSLALGLVALILLSWRHQRLRRNALLAAERRAIERRSEERLRALLEHATDVATVIGSDLRVRWQSNSIKRMLGVEPGSLVGRPITEIVDPPERERVDRFLASSLVRKGTRRGTARFRHATGGSRDVELIADNRLQDPAVEGLVLSLRDITERKALEDELRHRAFHDPLTGLANRALFEDRLWQAVARARRRQQPFGVLFLDLDDFKRVNDSVGHTRGDELLRAVAQRIGGILRLTDTAARMGGDEFAILLDALEDEQAAHAIAERLLETIELPFTVGDRAIRITASLGVAIWSPREDVEHVLRHADIAMYAAKEQGKASLRVFEPRMYGDGLDRLALGDDLPRAIESRQFELDYQPIVELASGRIVGVEALVRWEHPERTRLQPKDFIEVAEETGLITPLGQWVLEAACWQARGWQVDVPQSPALWLSVNVSSSQLRQPDFADRVGEVIDASGMPAETIVLEITENRLVNDREMIVDQLHRLELLGVRVAIDDFGKGYSALSYLQRLPVDVLKIDRSFIDGIPHDPARARLTRGIATFGRSLRLEVIAEGIESPAQADELRSAGVLLGQGFWFSPPVSADELYSLLSAGRVLDHPRDSSDIRRASSLKT
jgi:diguanylate cyclase (GGDEF)-like protein/PAS domain S-box-containing protein